MLFSQPGFFLMHETVLQTVAITAALATGALMLGRWLRMPTLLFFMLLGLVAGPSVLGLIHPESLGNLLLPFIELAVAIIIFEAALALPFRTWKHAPTAIRRILAFTLPLTGLGAFLAARYIAGFSIQTAALFGSLIVVTGPTVIGPLLKSLSLAPRIESLLRWESIWADCIGVVASGVVLEFVLAPRASGFTIPLLFIGKAAVGLSIGAAGGLVLGKVLLPAASRTGDHGLPGIVALSSAVGLFFLSNTIISNSGVLSVAVAGLVTSLFPCRELDNVRHFKDQITTLVVAFLFVLLSAQIDTDRILHGSWPLVAVALTIAFIVRPAAVFIGLRGTGMGWRDKLYIGLVGPRGIISAGVASYFAIVLADRGVGVQDMHLLVFITIFVTGAAATILGKPLASVLGVAGRGASMGIVIAGGGQLAIAIARATGDAVRTLVVDRNPIKVTDAIEAGIDGREGDILSDAFLEELIDEGYRRIVIMTPNSALNALVAHKAARHFGADRTFLVSSAGTGQSLEDTIPRIRTIRLGTTIKLAEAGIESGDIGIEWIETAEAPAKFDEKTVPFAWQMPRDKGVHLAAPGGRASRSLCVVQKRSGDMQ